MFLLFKTLQKFTFNSLMDEWLIQIKNLWKIPSSFIFIAEVKDENAFVLLCAKRGMTLSYLSPTAEQSKRIFSIFYQQGFVRYLRLTEHLKENSSAAKSALMDYLAIPPQQIFIDKVKEATKYFESVQKRFNTSLFREIKGSMGHGELYALGYKNMDYLTYTMNAYFSLDIEIKTIEKSELKSNPAQEQRMALQFYEDILSILEPELEFDLEREVEEYIPRMF